MRANDAELLVVALVFTPTLMICASMCLASNNNGSFTRQFTRPAPPHTKWQLYAWMRSNAADDFKHNAELHRVEYCLRSCVDEATLSRFELLGQSLTLPSLYPSLCSGR